MDQVEAFAAEARLFQEWVLNRIEGSPAGAREALLRTTRLYLAALALPPAWNEELTGQPPAKRLSNDELQPVVAACARLPIDYYGDVFDPLPVPPEEPTIGSLADDIADIYRDVVSGLAEHEDGRRARAVWEWKFNFEHHWGLHAVNAIRVLHCWLAENGFDATP